MKIEEYEAAAEAILFAMGDSVELKKPGVCAAGRRAGGRTDRAESGRPLSGIQLWTADPGTGWRVSDLYKTVPV